MVTALSRECLKTMGLKERREVLFKEVTELRCDLDNIKDAHQLVQKEIKGIRRAMKLLLSSYHERKTDGGITTNGQTGTEQMLRLQTEYSRDIDLESMCADLPMLEPLSDDDVIFGEYQDQLESDIEEQMRQFSLQRRQSYQFGSPSPDNSYNVRRTSPTRASIHFGNDFGLGSPNFEMHEGSRPPSLASMPEDDQEQSDMTTESDTPASDTASEERDSFPSFRGSHEYHHSSRQHVHAERARYLKRQSTLDSIDRNSLRWSNQPDLEVRQYNLAALAKDRANPVRKRLPLLRRVNTQPNLFSTAHYTPNQAGSPLNSRRKMSLVQVAPLDSRGAMSLQLQSLPGRQGSISPTSPTSPTSPRSPNSSPRSGLIGSPLTSRRASSAAAAAAALIKPQNPLVRRVVDMV